MHLNLKISAFFGNIGMKIRWSDFFQLAWRAGKLHKWKIRVFTLFLGYYLPFETGPCHMVAVPSSQQHRIRDNCTGRMEKESNHQPAPVLI